MLGLVFTTTEEAAPFVDQYTDTRADALEEGSPVQTSEMVLLITGPGKIKATLGTEHLLRQYDLDALLHAGTCTTLDDDPSPGTLVEITSVLEGDRVELDAPTYPRMPLEPLLDDASETTLVSQDHTHEEADEKSYWERIADVRDSTGYAIAYVAAQHGTPCHVGKVVLNQLGETQNEEAKREACSAIAAFLQEVRSERTDDA